jgi:hypothetical protein
LFRVSLVCEEIKRFSKDVREELCENYREFLLSNDVREQDAIMAVESSRTQLNHIFCSPVASASEMIELRRHSRIVIASAQGDAT